jgi:hypothetical protein
VHELACASTSHLRRLQQSVCMSVCMLCFYACSTSAHACGPDFQSNVLELLRWSMLCRHGSPSGEARLNGWTFQVFLSRASTWYVAWFESLQVCTHMRLLGLQVYDPAPDTT